MFTPPLKKSKTNQNQVKSEPDCEFDSDGSDNEEDNDDITIVEERPDKRKIQSSSSQLSSYQSSTVYSFL